MIGKVTNGASFAGLAAYLHGPGRANEHAYGGREGGQVIGGSLLYDGDDTGREWARDMHDAAKVRPDIERPVWHLSLRAAPEDPTLSDAQWRDIAQGVGEQMGWSGQPWVMVRHGEDHVHVVVSRVDFEGRVWSRRNDRFRLRGACMKAEREHDLRRTPARSTEKTMRAPDHQLTQGEHRRGARTAEVPARVELAHRVRSARDVVAETGGGRPVFEAALSRLGVEFRANVASTGRMNGYSFHLPGNTDSAGEAVWMSASQLDRGLSWSKLAPVLAAPRVVVEPAEPVTKRLFESRAAYVQRISEAEQVATRDHIRATIRHGQQRTIADLSRTSTWWTSQHHKHRNALAGVAAAREQRQNLAEIRALREASFPGRRFPGGGRMMPTAADTAQLGARTAREIARHAPEAQRRRGLSW